MFCVQDASYDTGPWHYTRIWSSFPDELSRKQQQKQNLKLMNHDISNVGRPTLFNRAISIDKKY